MNAPSLTPLQAARQSLADPTHMQEPTMKTWTLPMKIVRLFRPRRPRGFTPAEQDMLFDYRTWNGS